MDRKRSITTLLAILGIAAVALPILAPFLFALMRLFQRGRILFDYLMPAELFPLAIAGSLLLFWAALRAHSSQRRLIGWGLAAEVFFLAAGLLLGVVTGLASGENEAAGWRWMLVASLLIAYTLSIILVGIGGGLLLSDLFKRPASVAEKIQA